MFNLNWSNLNQYVDEIEIVTDNGTVSSFYWEDDPRIWFNKRTNEKIQRENILRKINNIANDLLKEGRNPKLFTYSNGQFDKEFNGNTMFGKEITPYFKHNFRKMI